jgi:hypothetical protein
MSFSCPDVPLAESFHPPDFLRIRAFFPVDDVKDLSGDIILGFKILGLFGLFLRVKLLVYFEAHKE